MACRGMVGLGLAQRGAACFAGWTWKNLSSSTATTTPTDFAWVTDTAAPAAHVARTTWNVAVAFICFLSTIPSCCCFRCSLNGGSVADGVSNCMCCVVFSLRFLLSLSYRKACALFISLFALPFGYNTRFACIYFSENCFFFDSKLYLISTILHLWLCMCVFTSR